MAAGLDHRRDVFGETRPPVAGPRVKELGSDAMVEPHGFGHHLHVRSHPLAEIRHLVDKGHLGSKERVGGVLDHLGGGDVREDERGLDQVQGTVQVAHDRLGLRAVRADDHAVGAHEVFDGRAFAEEFRVRDDVEVGGPGAVLLEQFA